LISTPELNAMSRRPRSSAVSADWSPDHLKTEAGKPDLYDPKISRVANPHLLAHLD
jgi:hypothetical protein